MERVCRIPACTEETDTGVDEEPFPHLAPHERIVGDGEGLAVPLGRRDAASRLHGGAEPFGESEHRLLGTIDGAIRRHVHAADGARKPRHGVAPAKSVTLHQQRASAEPGRGLRRRDAGGTTPHHQHVDVRDNRQAVIRRNNVARLEFHRRFRIAS